MKAKARRFRFAFLASLICIALFVVLHQRNAAVASAEPEADLIESAMFARGEFFGAQALIPLPTAEARENLVRLSTQFPEWMEVIEKLAEAEERLGNFGAAEKALVRHSELGGADVEKLAAFYHRRARFADEANLLRKMLSNALPEARPALFERLFDLARKHDLPQFKSAQFLREVANENSGIFEVFVRIIDRLEIEKDHAAALEFLHQAKQLFPDERGELLGREIEMLTSFRRGDEAERVYIAAFDPYWPDGRADAFYGFLIERERLREYGSELKARFKADPANFDTAIRYAHYRAHNYEEITPVILKLEKAKTAWSADELLIVARLLIRDNNGDLASRFLYTLYNRFPSEPGADATGIPAIRFPQGESSKEQRSKGLYQLFEIFSDAEEQKLSLAKGDLSFYKDIAKTDTNPGIATGILSLLFADANVRGEFEKRETAANKYFNRAAAYRLFLKYREENSASPHLAQMHLDIVRLYTATGEVDIAERTLREFLANYRDSAEFASSAYKLADAFNGLERYDSARAIYRELLDHLGPKPNGVIAESATDKHRNLGINIPIRKPNNDDQLKEPRFRDHLGEPESAVSYREVLTKYVDSLNRERRTAEILNLLSTEIKNHPEAEWLYETRLVWLEKTNLTEDQLAIHREALDRFQSGTWRDKLARWFVRQGRQAEFSRFSADIVATLDDATVKEYLAEFADTRSAFSGFDGQLRRQLYLAAHQRFPRNPAFATGLLHIYAANKQEPEWRQLAAENYFAMKEVRELFLDRLAETGELRSYLSNAAGESAVYKLFRADAAIRLSNYEQANRDLS